MVTTHQEVLERVRAPLLTHASASVPETAYVALKHLHLLAQRAPMLFSRSFKSFFCRYSDPSYVKSAKLDLLVAVADEANAYEVVTEISEYVADVSPGFSREAVRAVAAIARAVPDASGLVERLLSFLDMGRGHVTCEVIRALPDVLRRYPASRDLVVNTAVTVDLPSIAEPDARAAMLWVLGVHGTALRSTPYVLEAAAAGFEGEEVPVKLALLTAAARTFFARPHETRPALGAALAAGAADPSRVVRERATLYHRLLRHDPSAAEQIIAVPIPEGTDFSSGETEEVRDRIFSEFNTLSVVYRQPAAVFVRHFEDDAGALAGPEAAQDPGARGSGAQPAPAPALEEADLLGASEEGLLSAPEQAAARGEDLGGAGLDGLGLEGGAGFGAAAAPPPAPAASVPIDLGDLLGGGGGEAAVQGPAPAGGAGALEAGATLDPAGFQQLWGAGADGETSVEVAVDPVATVAIVVEPERVKEALEGRGLCLVAHGGGHPKLKLLVYGKAGGGQVACEAMVDANYGEAKLRVRTVPRGSVSVDTVRSALGDAFASLAG